MRSQLRLVPEHVLIAVVEESVVRGLVSRDPVEQCAHGPVGGQHLCLIDLRLEMAGRLFRLVIGGVPEVDLLGLRGRDQHVHVVLVVVVVEVLHHLGNSPLQGSVLVLEARQPRGRGMHLGDGEPAGCGDGDGESAATDHRLGQNPHLVLRTGLDLVRPSAGNDQP